MVGPSPEDFSTAFEAGADEVMRAADNADESVTRLDAMLRRSDRDLTVHVDVQAETSSAGAIMDSRARHA